MRRGAASSAGLSALFEMRNESCCAGAVGWGPNWLGIYLHDSVNETELEA